MKKRSIPWGKFAFKACFILCLLLIEQASFIASAFVIYNRGLESLSVVHYLYCLPIMVIGTVILVDFFRITNFQRVPVQTILYDSFKFSLLFVSVVCIYAYLFNLYALSRYMLLLGGCANFIFTSLLLLIFQKLSRRVYRKSLLLVVSENENDARRIISKVNREAGQLNMEVIGWAAPGDMSGENRDFRRATEVLLSDAVGEKDKSDILYLCARHGKSIFLIPSFYDLSFSKYKVFRLYDTPSFFVENSGLSLQQQILKRVFDIIVSCAVLALTSPLFLVIPLLIKFDSKGKVFYTQERVTFNRKVYRVYKFRTMVSDAEKLYGAYQASENDPRITRVGRILRNSHMDELPQFFNVLLGQMSVVGPRSDRTITVDLFERQALGYEYRLKVKSGITGLAQLFGKYNTDPEDKLRYDIYYIKNFSLVMDLQIVLLTAFSVFSHSNYSMEKSNSDYYVANKSDTAPPA
jgi:exopolysaccharide biosynthesis polyprenyl glycosylphosphotransferase